MSWRHRHRNSPALLRGCRGGNCFQPITGLSAVTPELVELTASCALLEHKFVRGHQLQRNAPCARPATARQRGAGGLSAWRCVSPGADPSASSSNSSSTGIAAMLLTPPGAGARRFSGVQKPALSSGALATGWSRPHPAAQTWMRGWCASMQQHMGAHSALSPDAVAPIPSRRKYHRRSGYLALCLGHAGCLPLATHANSPPSRCR